MAEDERNDQATSQSSTGNAVAQKTTSEFNIRSVTVLTASALALFCSTGFLNGFGIFQAYYKLEYLPQLSNFQISWIGSFSVFMSFGCGPISGYLSDRFGPSLPIGIAVICQLVSIFMVSLCRKYYQFFLTQGVLLGMSFSLLSIPTTSISPLYFQRNRGLAQGVIISGSSLGGVIWPIVFDQLLRGDAISFGWTMRIVGFIQMPLLALVFIGVRRPPATKSQNKKSVEQPAEIGANLLEKGRENKRKDLSSLRHPSFIFLCAGLAVFYFGFFAPVFFVTTYAISMGTSASLATYLIAILNAASLFGRILPGYLADRVGHFNVMVCAMLGSAIVCFCWTIVTTTAGLIVWSLAYGFVSGAVLSLQFACASLVATRRIMGVAMGIMLCSIALTGLFGTPIAGELVKEGYLALSAFASATMLAGAALVSVARLARDRKLLAKA